MSDHLGKTEPEIKFDKDMSSSYDEHNKRLSKISDCLHFLSRLTLSDLPETARILCVGIGTGADILALSEAQPGWSFVGVDPSQDMLEVCRAKLEANGLADRCSFVHGYVQDVDADEFDAAVSFLVAHFVPRDERPEFYQAISARLKPGGQFVSAEISYDLKSESFPAMLQNWSEMQRLRGATPESLEKLPTVLRDQLSVLSVADTETLLQENGFVDPLKFFQAFMISGWHARKPD